LKEKRFDFELIEQYVESEAKQKYLDNENYLVFKDDLSLYVLHLYEKGRAKEKKKFLKFKLKLQEGGCIT
jgi:hypothetical protein